MNKVIKRFREMMIISLGVALLDVLIGFLFMAYTEFNTKINLIILGAGIVVHSLFFLIRYIYDGLGKKVFSIDLILGVAALILGIFTVVNPFVALDVIGIFFAIWLIITGVEKLYFGIKFLKKQEDIYLFTIFVSCLMFLMAVVTLFNPFASFMLITRLVGLFLICSGLFEMLICMLFRKRAKYILGMFK